MSLCHILVILTYFSLFLYLLWKSVIIDDNITLRLQLTEGSDDGYHFLARKYF